MSRVLGALCVLLCAACSPLRLLDAAIPSQGYIASTDLAYGALPRQKLDVYRPDPAAFPGTRPVIVFFYGGAWQTGARGEHRFIGEALASRGFVTVIPDYRVYPQVRYPEFVRDAARAFAWTHREIARFSGDPSHVVLMGHSAGAHIAAMLAYNERFLAEVGLSTAAVHGLIGLAGPYDFKPDEEAIIAALSGEGDASLAMPTRFVKAGAPPALLLQGDADRRVSPVNQERLAARLREMGDRVDARILPGYGHAAILVRLARPLRDEKLLDAIAQFAAR